ncbi:MAG: methyltransferase domain-containing protein [Polynucleobacter sp.]|nr:MAG: methyltransferase domain-containing protein [Polynucleobacter sp.]
MKKIDAAFWQEKYRLNQTGWDRGAVSPQLLAWCEQRILTPCRIVVPGCGSGWEVLELAKRGFEVVAIDYAEAALNKTADLLQKANLNAELIQADVLTLEFSNFFDAIYEQTCLCALHPDAWLDYSNKLYSWLKPKGNLFLMAMQAPKKQAIEEGYIDGPPYDCGINTIRALFSEGRWVWQEPPYSRVAHPSAIHELAVQLIKK